MLEIGNVIAAFSEEQVQRLTGLTKYRLRYWNRSDFFKPSFVVDYDEPGSAELRYYSFKDVVALRTLELLRVQNNVPLQHLRKVALTLEHLKDDLWTKTTLYVVNRKVVFENPETGKPEEVVSGQLLFDLPLVKVIRDTSNKVAQLRVRSKDQIGQVSRSRAIAHNALVVAGTRIPIGAIKRLHEDGFSTAEIIAEYPDLTKADVEIAIEFAPQAA